MARKKKQRRYSDEERANALAALAANGGNLSLTSRQLGIPRATIQAWANSTAHPEAAENAAPKKAELADRLDVIAHQLLDGLTEDKIKLAGAPQLMTAFGIAVDKAQLLKGKPTAINDNTHRHDDLSDAELDARIAELEARVHRAAGTAGHPPSPP